MTTGDWNAIEFVLTQVACEAAYRIRNLSLPACRVLTSYLRERTCLSQKTKERLIAARRRKLERGAR